MSRRQRYRGVRQIVLGIALLAGIGYPLVLALGGSALVAVHTGARGPSISIHNARPWLIVAAVAAVLLLVDRARSRPPGRPRPETSPEPVGPARPARAAVDADGDAWAAGTEEREARAAARRSEREWNAALDAALVALWVRTRPAPERAAHRRAIADLVLELTMELVEAGAGVLLIATPPARLEPLASRGVSDPQQVAADLVPSAPGEIQRRRASHGAEWLLVPLAGSGGPAGVIVLGHRSGGFAGLDEDVLTAAARRAAGLLEPATAED